MSHNAFSGRQTNWQNVDRLLKQTAQLYSAHHLNPYSQMLEKVSAAFHFSIKFPLLFLPLASTDTFTVKLLVYVDYIGRGGMIAGYRAPSPHYSIFLVYFVEILVTFGRNLGSISSLFYSEL